MPKRRVTKVTLTALLLLIGGIAVDQCAFEGKWLAKAARVVVDACTAGRDKIRDQATKDMIDEYTTREQVLKERRIRSEAAVRSKQESGAPSDEVKVLKDSLDQTLAELDVVQTKLRRLLQGELDAQRARAELEWDVERGRSAERQWLIAEKVILVEEVAAKLRTDEKEANVRKSEQAAAADAAARHEAMTKQVARQVNWLFDRADRLDLASLDRHSAVRVDAAALRLRRLSAAVPKGGFTVRNRSHPGE